jgi:hypothetical protein
MARRRRRRGLCLRAEFPDFLGVFLAFDAGEYRHPGDGEDVDREVKYTRPLIADIVRELREA